MENELGVFVNAILANKTPEAWLSILGGAGYVWYKSGAETRIGRALEAGISSLMAMAVGPDISERTQYPITFVYLGVTVFGFFVLDVGTSIVSDKKEIAEILKAAAKKVLRIDNDGKDK